MWQHQSMIKFGQYSKGTMALSEFEIAIGGISAIPVVGGLIFLGYKSFGESSLDTGKLKPIKKPAVAKETPTPDKKIPKINSQKPENNNNNTAATKEKTSPSEQPKAAKEETSISSKNSAQR